MNFDPILNVCLFSYVTVHVSAPDRCKQQGNKGILTQGLFVCCSNSGTGQLKLRVLLTLALIKCISYLVLLLSIVAPHHS